MKDIIRFVYEHLTNEAHTQLHVDFDILALKYTPEMLGIAPLYAQYRLLLEQEKQALNAISKSELSGEIVALDRRRDQLFRGFADAVKSAQNHYDPAKQQVAEKLHAVLTHYGNIAARTTNEETAALDDLQRELTTPENAARTELLGLTDWLAQLHAANRTYADTVRARYAEATTRPMVSMRAARQAVDKVFRTMLDVLDAMAALNATPDYTTFSTELNALMAKYELQLKQEKGIRQANAKTN